MSYINHKKIVCKWGVELVGWTDAKIENPAAITSSLALGRLLGVLHNGNCHWSPLTQESWDD